MIYLKEALPNPLGRDTDGEWIKLFNDGDEEKVLTGWVLKDKSGKSFLLDGKSIKPLGELELKYSETRIALNNDGDTLILYDQGGKEVDRLEYQSVSEEEIIVAAQFQTITEQSPVSNNVVGQISSGVAISGGYEFWPVAVGFSIALVAGVLGSSFYKKLGNN